MLTRGLLLALATTAVLYLMARTTGSGWVMVLFSALAATIVVSAVWSLLILRATAIGAAAPSDGVVGEPFTMTVRTLSNVTAQVRVQLRPTVPHDARALPAPVALSATPSVECDVVPSSRGIERRTEVEVVAGAPLGLVWWRRRDRVTLDAPIFIGPRPSGGPGRPARPDAQPGSNRLGPASEVVRGARSYHPGDPMRSVHWPATARTGLPMVKEFEHDDHPTLLFVVDLTGPDGELVASQVATEAACALEAGHEVRMVTMEAAGQVDGLVASRREIGRRLACTITNRAPLGA